jgi:Tol biopolymer transport system component
MTDFTERLQTAVVDRYRIERRLGEGGMATVYLAHDLKHDRPVALKVLRPELAAVIGAERFLAEIRTTANLQHPNILPLFDSGDADGQLFYVMPYVEGESLRERLEREKQLPVEDAVKMGVEVASALDYAHRQGVVHRDIKPENILLHDGRALVADFGIALALSTAGGSRMTETGMSVGTPAYMSPEQAMGGHEVTGRSDVYALGATLYEALVGEPPFTGPTAQAIIARLVTEDPRPLVSQRKTVPAHVEAAVLTALERLPADRFATAAEFGEALEGRSARPVPPSGRASSRVQAATPPSQRNRILVGGALAVLVIVALWGWLRPSSRGLTSREAVVLGPTLPGYVGLGAAIAPDGSAIVYADTLGGSPGLWIKERDELNGRLLVPLVNLAGGGPPGPAFSPDGGWIVFADLKLKKIARQGGAPIVLSDSAASFGAAWLDDGTIVFIGGNGDKLFRTDEAGEPARRLLTSDFVKGQIVRIAPVPGARAVLVAVGPPNARELAVDLATDSVHELSRGAMGGWIVPGGYLVYSQVNGALFAAPFDRKRLALDGPPVSILDGIRTTGGLGDLVLGADGTMLYVEGGADIAGQRYRLVSVARNGSGALPDSGWTATAAPNGGLDLSPDGTRVALSVTDSASGRSDLYVFRLPHGPATRLTFNGTANIRPTWSGDGRNILYVSDAAGKMEVWTRRADGSGQPVRVVANDRPIFEALWSPDGKWIVFRTDDVAAGNGDILAVRTGEDSAVVPLVATDAEETGPALSPDGHWLAYASNATGRKEIYVRPFPDAENGLWQVSTDGGSEPRWSRDAQTLFYRNATGTMMAASVKTEPTFSVGARTALFDARPYLPNDDNHYYALAPDGRFLMLRAATSEIADAAGGRMVLVRGWLPELRAKLGG